MAYYSHIAYATPDTDVPPPWRTPHAWWLAHLAWCRPDREQRQSPPKAAIMDRHAARVAEALSYRAAALERLAAGLPHGSAPWHVLTANLSTLSVAEADAAPGRPAAWKLAIALYGGTLAARADDPDLAAWASIPQAWLANTVADGTAPPFLMVARYLHRWLPVLRELECA